MYYLYNFYQKEFKKLTNRKKTNNQNEIENDFLRDIHNIKRLRYYSMNVIVLV